MKPLFRRTGIAVLIVIMVCMCACSGVPADPFPIRELSRYTLEEEQYFTGASVTTNVFEVTKDFVSEDSYKVYEGKYDITNTAQTVRTGLILKNVSQGNSVTVVVKGDINGDGKLLSSDYLILKKAYSGETELKGAAENAADINSDERLTSADGLILKQYFSGADYFKKDIDVELTYVDFTKVKNVIFMIGDGMGPCHLDVARDVTGGNLKGKLYMDYIPNRGREITDSLDGTTDSAAGATALASGHKTHNGVVGRDGNGKDVETLTERCMSKGMKTGIISTKVSTDATPASFTAHTDSRANAVDIASQQLANMPEVLIGLQDNSYTEAMKIEGVSEAFVPHRTRMLYTTENILAANTDRIWGTMVGGSFDLAAVTEKSLQVLSQNNQKGFFIMIEGGKIDSYSHSNDGPSMIRELMEFDLAVKVAMEYVTEHPDTLLIVTADHETGGLRYTPGQEPVYAFTTENHTSAQPYVMALGYGAEYFNNTTVDNTDIPKFIAQQLGFNGFCPER